jgi:microcystin-dependent protein
VITSKILDANVTLAKLEASLQATLTAIDPADAIMMIGGLTAPSGWALCDGAPYSRTTYAATFARIGTTYGVGDGSTTFNVPDMRNRFPVMKGPTAWSDTLNESGGTKDLGVVTHSHANSFTASQDAHTHGVGSLNITPAGYHTHNVGAEDLLYNSAVPSGYGLTSDAGAGVRGSDFQPVGDHDHGITGNTDTASANAVYISGAVGAVTGVTAVDGVDDNLPPFRVLNFCIRLR